MKEKLYTTIIVDIVGYTKYDLATQLQAFQCLQREVSYLFYNEIISGEALLIPIGDGMIIALEMVGSDNLAAKHYDYLKKLIFTNLFILYSICESRGIRLRTAINRGEGIEVKDVTGKTNIVGKVINDTVRLLSELPADSIVVGKNFFDTVLKEQSSFKIGAIEYRNGKASLELTIGDEITIIDKHGYSHYAYTATINSSDDKIVGIKEIPYSSFIGKINFSEEETKGTLPTDRRFYELVESLNNVFIIEPCLITAKENVEKIVNQFNNINIRVYIPSIDIFLNSLKSVFSSYYNCGYERSYEDECKEFVSNLPRYGNVEIFSFNTIIPFSTIFVCKKLENNKLTHPCFFKIVHFVPGGNKNKEKYFDSLEFIVKDCKIHFKYFDFIKEVVESSQPVR